MTLSDLKSEIRTYAGATTLTRQTYTAIADEALFNSIPILMCSHDIEASARLYKEASTMNTNDWLGMACLRIAIKLLRHARTGQYSS